MQDARPPEQPDSTIQYSAVRSEKRLFGDYSVVDRGILTQQSGDPDRSVQDDEETPESPSP